MPVPARSGIILVNDYIAARENPAKMSALQRANILAGTIIIRHRTIPVMFIMVYDASVLFVLQGYIYHQ